MEISFENTETAFSAKSDAELFRAYLLFKLVANNTLVKAGRVITNIAIKSHLPIRPFIKATIFKQFCGGESISDCDPTIASLAVYQIGTILDYSVEGKHNESSFNYTTKVLIEATEKANVNPNIPFSVFKMSGIARFGLLEKINEGKLLTEAEKEEWARVSQRVGMICKAAHEASVPVFIDAEESWVQDAVDNLALEMMRLYNKEKPIVFNTLQMYRTGRIDYMKMLHKMAVDEGFFIGMKIVRGAYMEKERERAKKMGYPSPIQPDKIATDKDYDDVLLYCIKHIDRIAVCAGTHNETSTKYLLDLMEEYNIGRDNKNIYFAQLYGMSDHISFNLAKEGYNVAKYVPYGPVKEVLPYLIRRAEENTSVAGQTGRELRLISTERERRKKVKKSQES
ncbi:MAG: proline dehydrogenase family protein [Bacteroidetes bacterium]|nr:proline dehydrogenase family protein [Bacteroidota bacterium]